MATGFRAGVGVKAKVFRSGRVLLLRRSATSPQYAGFWDLPGGSVQDRETLEEALLRETREETAFRLRVDRPYHAAVIMWPGGDGRVFPSVGVYFRTTLLSKGNPRLRPNEHSEYAWVPRNELGRFRMPAFWAKAVRLAFDRRR
jgi:8-oxo-dGTP pyrophosphatase MutT (NUDIX family)